MISFEKGKALQVINVKVNDVILWSEIQLKALLGYEFKVWCSPHIGRNYLNYDIDETEMTDEQWRIFSNFFNISNGYNDNNLVKLLCKVFGEGEYIFKVHELDQFYIIKHVKKDLC